MVLNHQILGQGPPLIILHGFLGSSDNWMTVARQLSTVYKVFLVDLRNHGSSFHHDQFNYSVMARDIEILMDQNNLETSSILGHSMGGKTAMFYTANNQHRVTKLVVVDIAPKYYPVHHREILDGLISINLEHLESRSDADKRLKKYVNEAPIRQFLLKNLKRNREGLFEWKVNLSAIDKQIDNIGEALPDSVVIKTETLFIKGGASHYISDSDFAMISRQFPNSTVITVSDAGHWVHAQAAEELIQIVKEFIG